MRVAAELAARGVVAQPRAWVLYARFKGLASSIKAGEYEIEPGATPRTLLEKLVSGQVLLHSFTIVDGWRVADLLAALKRNPDIAVTLPDAPQDLMQQARIRQARSRGRVLAGDLSLSRAEPPESRLLRQAHVALERELESAWADRDPTLPLHSPYELLIAASIVAEGERYAAGACEDRRSLSAPLCASACGCRPIRP